MLFRSKEKLNLPRYLLPVYGVYCFFAGFGAYIRESARNTLGFYKEFFAGLPVFFSYLKREHRKKTERKAAEKRKKKLQKHASKKNSDAIRKEEKEEKKFQKKLDKRQKRDARREERRAKRSLFVRILPCLLAGAVVTLELSFCGRFLFLYVKDAIDAGESAVTMNVYFEKNDQSNTTVPGKYAHTAGGTALRFDMTFLAGCLGLRTFGGEESVLYTTSAGDKLRVYNNSNTVVINGRRIGLSSTVVFDRTKVYVPLELIRYYTDGLEISYDRESKLLTLTCGITASKTDENYKEGVLVFLPYGERPTDPPLIL